MVVGFLWSPRLVLSSDLAEFHALGDVERRFGVTDRGGGAYQWRRIMV
jgi:hypothetical protein